jgi:zinc protease
MNLRPSHGFRSVPAALSLMLLLVTHSPASMRSPGLARRDWPLMYDKLRNGLKVVLYEDRGAPLATVAVYYNVGFRMETKGRTGFAHLFEHMMFQGSEHIPKSEFVRLLSANSATFNGNTRYDYTRFFEVVPVNKLETMLWAEADRMRGLTISEETLKNQQGVVGNEVKETILNAAYGGFPWVDLPQYANSNWQNAHNFRGDLADIEAATIDDVRGFFKSHYAPNNAVLVVAGDFEAAAMKRTVAKYFGDIPAAPIAEPPSSSEPRQEKEKRGAKIDRLASHPALAFGFHMPERNTRDYYAMGLLDQILLQGEDSLLYQELVNNRRLTAGVDGGVNPVIGNMFNYKGPMLWAGWLFFDSESQTDSIVAAIDRVIGRLLEKPIDSAVLERAKIKMRSSLYDTLEYLGGFGRVDLLASFALFDDRPQKISSLESEFARVDEQMILRTAREYLRPGNRTILVVSPAKGTK